MSRPIGSSPQLDRLIAQSKHITADLMTVRRDATRVMTGHAGRIAIDSARSRISLVVEQMHAMSQELWTMWEDSSPYKHTEPAPRVRDAKALENGQLRLIGGR